jgi:CubicO group peptidase (beta-lactamase class C family)
MKHLIFPVIFLFALFFSSNTYSQSADTTDRIKQVENNLTGPILVEGDIPYTIAGQMAQYNIKGVSVAVIHNYKLEWAKGYGWADEGLKIPVTAQTLFQAASISKSVNSVGVLKLVQDKKIDLYADINTYLTTWQFPYDSLSKGKKISIANLLSHTGGLTVHGFGGYERGKDTIPTMVQILNGQKPANSPPIRSMYEPGLKSEYSGGGITISQMIVTDVTRHPYDKYMYDNVLKPLGMNSSTYAQPPVDVKPELLATAYYADGKEMPGKYHIYPEQAAAGLWTTPTDLAKYIIETQLAYAGKSHKVLDQQTTRLRLTPYIDKSAALGVFIDNMDSTKYFEHSGANEGFRCAYYGSLENGNGVVVMVNSDNGDIIPEIVNSVAKVYGFKGLYHTIVKKTTAVADTVLEKYVGRYELTPKNTLTITREGSHLYGQPTGEQRLELFPESQNKFFLKLAFIEVEFVSDNKGEISKVVIYQNGTHEAKRLK